MTSVVHLSDRRKPVCYTIHITQYWDDRLEIFVEDVADDQRSRESIADALERAAESFRSSPIAS